VTGKDHVFVAGPKREPLFAVQAGKNGKLDDSAISWKFDEFPPDVCVPVYYQDKLFVFDGDEHVMTCVDPKSGEKIWQTETGGNQVYRSSPTAADGKLYITDEDGMIVVLGLDGSIISRIEMGGNPVRASIVPLDGQLLIRTKENLYCIGK
jgi:outer membrane protein assembly factor BamB